MARSPGRRKEQADRLNRHGCLRSRVTCNLTPHPPDDPPPLSGYPPCCFCWPSGYRERHLVECFINKFKHFRRLFSRFDKLDRRFLAFLSFVAALIWLR